MKRNFIRLSALVTALFLCVCFALPAFAAWEDSNITVIDYLDYADRDHLVIDGDYKYIEITIPTDYGATIFVSADGEKARYFVGNNVYSALDGIEDGCKLVSFPIADYEVFEHRFDRGFVIDVSNVPDYADISCRWELEFANYTGEITADNTVRAYNYFYYFGEPDAYGFAYRTGRTAIGEYIIAPTFEANSDSLYAGMQKVWGDGSQNVVGTATNYVCPVFAMDPFQFSYLGANATVRVKLSDVVLRIPITEELFELAQADKTNKLIEETNRQLAEQNKNLEDIISGTPEQNEAADEAAGILGDKGEQLGGLADDIQTDKPDLDSVDVDSIIPSNGINTLSGAISPIAENPLVIKILVMVGTLLLVSYVLFGKRG